MLKIFRPKQETLLYYLFSDQNKKRYYKPLLPIVHNEIITVYKIF